MRLLGDNLESLYDKKRAWILSLPFFIILLKVKSPDIINNTEAFWKRAEDGTRTRDPNLGKVMLYQLSYFRVVALFSFASAKVDEIFVSANILDKKLIVSYIKFIVRLSNRILS